MCISQSAVRLGGISQQRVGGGPRNVLGQQNIEYKSLEAKENTKDALEKNTDKSLVRK